MPRLKRTYPGQRFDAKTIRAAYDCFQAATSADVPERRVAAIQTGIELERLPDARRFFEKYDSSAESAELTVEYTESRFQFSYDSLAARFDISMPDQTPLDMIARLLRDGKVGINVFLGHGRSEAWLHLLAHLEGESDLTIYTYEESAQAGVTAIELLTELGQMVDFAVLVHTQDRVFGEQDLSPSDNVVHETGFFQGALGRHSTLVVRELGCVPFANIGGIHELAFPPGGIETTFDGVVRLIRRACDRSG